MHEICNCHSQVRQKHHDREQVSGRRSSRRRNRLLDDIHEGDRRRRRRKHLAHGQAEHPAAHPRDGPVRAQPHPLVGNQPRDHRGGALQALADRPQPDRTHRHHTPARILRPPSTRTADRSETASCGSTAAPQSKSAATAANTSTSSPESQPASPPPSTRWPGSRNTNPRSSLTPTG